MKNSKNGIVLMIIAALCVGEILWANDKTGTIRNGINKTIMLRLVKHGLWTDLTLKPGQSWAIAPYAFDSAEFHITKAGIFNKRPPEILTTSLKNAPNWKVITLVQRNGKFEIDVS